MLVAKEMIDMQLITAIEQELIVARLCLMATEIFIFLLNINAICVHYVYIFILNYQYAKPKLPNLKAGSNNDSSQIKSFIFLCIYILIVV